MSTQSFGEHFELTKLLHARSVAREICYELSSMIQPGMTEKEALGLYKSLCEKYPIQKQWHPPKLRFGPNTLCNFRDESLPYVLNDEDLFFIDIGPVVDGHEADYGETFSLGNNFSYKNISLRSKSVFTEVREYFLTNKVTGQMLYEFAQKRAQHYGLILNLGQDGHRIGDFPHHIHFRGGLPETNEVIIPNAWILEIHLFDHEKKFGAFFEDLLTDRDLED